MKDLAQTVVRYLMARRGAEVVAERRRWTIMKDGRTGLRFYVGPRGAVRFGENLDRSITVSAWVQAEALAWYRAGGEEDWLRQSGS